MKVVVIFAALCVSLAAAHPLVKTPSASSCDVDTSCDDSSYDLQGLKITFSPDPPEKGKDVTITASGTLSKQISGGTIKVVAKYGLITILDQEYNVCDLVQDINMTCPLAAGPLSGSATTHVPGDVPGGKYHVDVSATDQDGGKLLCGQASCDV